MDWLSASSPTNRGFITQILPSPRTNLQYILGPVAEEEVRKRGSSDALVAILELANLSKLVVASPLN